MAGFFLNNCGFSNIEFQVFSEIFCVFGNTSIDEIFPASLSEIHHLDSLRWPEMYLNNFALGGWGGGGGGIQKK